MGIAIHIETTFAPLTNQHCIHSRHQCITNEMKVRLFGSLILASTMVFSASSLTLAQTAKQDIKNAGTDTKDATKSAGHGIAKGTKHAYHATKRGTKKVVHKSARGTRKAADKVEDKSAPKPQ
jgi:hypothetical protein